ncbi:MAG: TonB-dependent receptor [Bacteroidia bacterium]
MSTKFFLSCFIYFSFLIGTPVSLLAQNAKVNVKGKVMDADSRSVLEYATVTLRSLPDSTVRAGIVTDAKGKFNLAVIPGRYLMQVEFLGYESRQLPAFDLSLDQDPYNAGEIYLQQGATTLDAVEITSEKSQVEFALDKKIFNVGQDINRIGGNAADILDNIPSVTVDVDGNVQLRGSSNVRILVNGRPSGLTGVSSADALAQFPANMIERVEIITNPSARYEAEGSAGIINIVLKKEQRQGWNGIFSVNTGWPHNHGASVNLNYRREKVNFFVNYGVRYRSSPGRSRLTQEIYKGDSTFVLDQISNFTRGGLSNSIRLGTDFFINPKNTLTAAIIYRIGQDFNDGRIEYQDFGYQNILQSVDVRTTAETEDESNLDYNLNYKKTFDKKGHEWTADLIYSSGAETESMNAQNNLFNANYQSLGEAAVLQRINNSELERELVLQTDYVQPIGENGKFEAGYRTGIRRITNDYLTEEFDNQTQLWERLGFVSNQFEYDEDIHATYAIYGNKYDKFSYQLGLRGEYSNITTRLIETAERNDKNYFNLFPSAHFTYEFANENSVQLGYSRRVRRPRFWDLNPFFTFMNPLFIRSGNPDLNPEFTHAMDLSYLKYWDKASLSTGIYYRHTDGVIQRITTVDELGVSRSMPQNLAVSRDMGLELSLSYEAVKWWRLNASSNLFRGSLIDPTFTTELNRSYFSWTARMNSQFKLPHDIEAQIQANFRGAQQTAQGTRRAFVYTDFGINKDVLDGKATVNFRVRDIFNSGIYRYETFGEGFSQSGVYQRRQRTFTLGFAYRLNQKKDRRGGRGNGGGGGGYDDF